jgi:hypothetical protein
LLPCGTVAVRLTERVICDPTVRLTQTATAASPLVVAMPYRACK